MVCQTRVPHSLTVASLSRFLDAHMTALNPIAAPPDLLSDTPPIEPAAPTRWRLALRNGRIVTGGLIVLLIGLACLVTLPWTISATGPGHPLLGVRPSSPLYF